MLFDLRGKGRRRAVRVIYIGLAVLMGVGLVGFGIGGGFGGGGLFNAATSNEGSGHESHSSEIAKYRKLTAKQPTNAEAWERLTKALLLESGGRENYVAGSGLTSQAKEQYAETSQAWLAYLALKPPNPSVKLAKGMVNVYGVEGLEEPVHAVQALNIITEADPTSYYYNYLLAAYAYKAKNTRVGDLASARAVSLVPAAQRVRLKKALAEIKKNPTGATSGSSTAAGSSTGTGTSSNEISIGGVSTSTTSTPTTTTKK